VTRLPGSAPGALPPYLAVLSLLAMAVPRRAAGGSELSLPFLLGMPLSMTPGSSIIATILLQIVPLLAFPFLMFFLSRYSSGLSRMLSFRPIVFGGEVSYSIYLLHPFVLLGTTQLFAWVDQTNVTGQLGFMAATTAVVIVISIGTYRFIERPAKKWLRGQRRQHSDWCVFWGQRPGFQSNPVEVVNIIRQHRKQSFGLNSVPFISRTSLPVIHNADARRFDRRV
jgi:peptidoglycan/LPS O-acetylase OafA/YrhL